VEKITRDTPQVPISRGEKREAFAAILSKISGFNVVHKLPFADRNSRRLKWLASFSACAVVLLCISVTLNCLQYFRNNQVQAVSDNIAENHPVEVVSVAQNEQTFYTENGIKAKIMLPDSSVVWLNSGSSITYPQNFSGAERTVKFSGEGYFDIRKNEQEPMVVTTPRGMKVKVLGTKFHICSYDDDADEQATLFSGKINISRVVDNEVVVKEKEMRPLESVNFSNANKAVLVANSDTTKKIAWKNGELLFENTPMSDVVKKLERWHGADIIVKDFSILKYKFTARFRSESIVQILELLTFTAPVDFSIENNQVFLSERKNNIF
jgi:ferric-dicitrate binding protein FerR (iron transport regulator)